MSIELIAGHGIRSGDCDLGFGMAHHDLVRAAQPYAAMRATWVCGASWAERLEFADADVLGYADQADRLAAFSIEHWFHRDNAAGPAVVEFDGLDIFGHRSGEITAYLRAAGHRIVEARRSVQVGPELVLYRQPVTRPSVAGRRARHRSDPDEVVFDSLLFRATWFDSGR